MWTYDGKEGPPPVDLNDPIVTVRQSDLERVVREVDDLVASDLLAEERRDDMVGHLEVAH